MITLISPAKNMRPAGRSGLTPRRPLFSDRAAVLLAQLRDYSPAQLESLMDIQPGLALTACAYFAACDLSAPGWTALTAYSGLQYKNIGADTLSPAEFSFLAGHLLILSGFYGLLRPDDGIQPYRLEMGGRLRFEGQTLYQFWGDSLYRAVFAQKQPVLNLASAEYAKVIQPHLQPGDIWIRCDFLTRRRGALRTLATEAKMARGQMVRAIAQNQWDAPAQLCEFSWNGYQYAPALSNQSRLAFVKE